MKSHFLKSFLSKLIILIAIPNILFGYIGPGTSLSVIGTLVACIAGVGLAILGFLWYPIKRLRGNRSQEPDQVTDDMDDQEPAQD